MLLLAPVVTENSRVQASLCSSSLSAENLQKSDTQTKINETETRQNTKLWSAKKFLSLSRSAQTNCDLELAS